MKTSAVQQHDLHDFAPDDQQFLEEVFDGLSRPRKLLPCKYLYDRVGSQLFDQICELDEYYPTRTEAAIMRTRGPEMAGLMGPRCLLIEYGSGSSAKTGILLDHLIEPAGYVPIDISRQHLIEAAQSVRDRRPGLRVTPVCADYTGEFTLPDEPGAVDRRVVFFPGSTIGNFHLDAALNFLRRIASVAGRGGGLLIGADLRKDRLTLERAYDDAGGVTARFNLNLLARINRELGGDFDLDAFEHRAVYNEDVGRMEIYAVSRRRQRVRVGGRDFDFDEDERIRTECSYKYSLEQFRGLTDDAGFDTVKVWTDEQSLFSIHYLTAR